MHAGSVDVRIELLGDFRVALDGREIAEDDWPSRRARELTALLALAGGRRLQRDQVIEQLWPHLRAQAGAANLRKAAHHARRTLEDPEAIVLRAGRVELFPQRGVTTDVADFLRDAEAALRDADADGAACAKVAARCAGELLPSAPYETWTQQPRRQVHARLTELLRRNADWERLVELEPADEATSQELMRAAIEAGRRHVAIRWYERLRIAMLRELGAQPGAATRALYDRCTAGVRLGERAFVGRERDLAAGAEQLAAAAQGATAALLVRGPTGIGKSAFCREVLQRAHDSGWRVLTVTAMASASPYGRSAWPSSSCWSTGAPRSTRCPTARARSSLRFATGTSWRGMERMGFSSVVGGVAPRSATGVPETFPIPVPVTRSAARRAADPRC